MATSGKDLVQNSWRSRDDAAVAREVATKGEFVEVCIEYLAHKRKISIEESKNFFNNTVNEYVLRLLNDKLVCKAENVLGNLRRDFRSIYYQFAFECNDESVKSTLLEHVKKKDPVNFVSEKSEYEFYWNVLREAEKCERIAEKLKSQLNEINLENLFQKDESYRVDLVTEVYFNSANDDFLVKLEKKSVLRYLVQKNLSSELIEWFWSHEKDTNPGKSKICEKYQSWPFDKDMLEYVIQKLKTPTDVLRNCLANYGYLFPDESNDVKKALSRLVITEKEKEREGILPFSLPLGRYLYENKLYPLLLHDFVMYEELAKIETDSSTDLDFILTLKRENLDNRESILKILEQISKSFENNESQSSKIRHPLVLLAELLLRDSSIKELESQPHYDILKNMPYIEKLLQKIDVPEIPKVSAYDLLKKFKNLDLNEVTKDAGEEPVSFSNTCLSQKYSQKLKLNYLHYVKQQRSSYAVYQFFLEQLKGYSNVSKSQLFGSAEVVTEFAVRNCFKDDLVLHSVAFIEMLGFDTQNLRSLVKLMKMTSNSGQIETLGVFNYTEIIEGAERKLFSDFNNCEGNSFPLAEYDAIIQVAHCHQMKKMPKLLLLQLAERDDWWKILVLIQYFSIPLNHVKKVFKSFKTPSIGNHLLRALSHEPFQEKVRRRSSVSRQRTRLKADSNLATASGEIMTTSLGSTNEANQPFKTSREIKLLQEAEDIDIFALILLSSNSNLEEKISTFSKFLEIITDPHLYSTSVNLMKNCIKYELPILSVLSVVVSDLNLHWCWLIWLAVSTKNVQMLEASKDQEEVSLKLIEFCVENGFTRTLNKSFQIFYHDNKFTYFTKFLQQTVDLDFTDDSIDYLRLYLLAWSNEEVSIPLTELSKDQLMDSTVKLLILHLKYNLSSTYYQQMLLNVICQSGISDINQTIDFCLLRSVFEIISFSEASIDFENLLIINEETSFVHNEYENALQILRERNEYDRAIQLAILLGLSISDIIFSKWVDSVDSESHKIDFDSYERDTVQYSLAPEMLMKFYLDVACQIPEPTPEKYLLLKKSLDVFKKNRLLPNECFDSDQIEYEMVLCFLQSNQTIEDLDIYDSEYFEEILLNERCVLYKSFSELKSLAGIEDLTTSLKVELTENMKLKLACLLNKLLDEGDIVEALRLQAIFEYRPIDLHFIVFCMGLAEGLTSIFNLSKDERQMLADVEKSSITKFDKRTLGRVKVNLESSVSRDDTLDSTSTTLGFEEIPSREKKEVLEALQGIASRLKYGIDLGKRIVMVYRAAMHLEKDYLDVLRMKDTSYLLKSATEEECLHKFLVVSDLLTSTKMTPIEIAQYLSYEIATSIIRPRFYIFRVDQSNVNLNLHPQNTLWGHHDLDKEFHLFLELCPNTTILGNAILDYCDALKVYKKFQDKKDYQHELEKNPKLEVAFNSLREIIQTYGQPNIQSVSAQVLSHKKQNTICIELLIKAHECFVHECSMAGIANVLNRTKALNTILSTAKSWNLIVRMLTGIGRYREMYYCFDTLIKNDQFESLLGQFDEEKTNGLRQAIISYIREYCPENQECLKLAALHFLMYKDLAEMWEQEANSLIAKLLSENQILDETSTPSKNCDENKSSITNFKCSPQVLNTLNQILENFTHATENYLLDNKLRLARKSASNAELVAMQIDLVSKGISIQTQTCICVLNIRSKNEFKELINTELRIPQALILGRAYSYEINWSEAILSQYVLLGKNNYLEEYMDHMELQDSMIENIVKSFQLHSNILPRMEENLATLVGLVQSVSLRYKLASILGFKKIITALINDQSLYYLKDSNYGRNESDFPV